VLDIAYLLVLAFHYREFILLLSTEEQDMNLVIDKSKVVFVYSGKAGCACGCNGSYKYAAAHRAFASKNRGYKVDDNEINERSISIIVNKVVKMAAEGNAVKSFSETGATNVSVEVNGRLYMIFVRN
jgi:hypothetical protein